MCFTQTLTASTQHISTGGLKQDILGFLALPNSAPKPPRGEAPRPSGGQGSRGGLDPPRGGPPGPPPLGGYPPQTPLGGPFQAPPPPGGGPQGGANTKPVLRLGSLYGDPRKTGFWGFWAKRGYIIYIAHPFFVQQLFIWVCMCVFRGFWGGCLGYLGRLPPPSDSLDYGAVLRKG